VRLFWRGELLSDIDPDLLVENAPVYDRPMKRVPSPYWQTQLHSSTVLGQWHAHSSETILQALLRSAEGCSRDWIFRQYDQRVGTLTMRDCTQSVAALRLPDSQRALGLALGCRPHVMRADRVLGGIDSVMYPALELAAKGFTALAVTDCLNFGNPENPQVMGEFVASLEAMSAACEKLDAPIISGNVSLYNETLGQSISPTPSTGLVGLKESAEQIPLSQWSQPGLAIFAVSAQHVVSAGFVAELAPGGIPALLGASDIEKWSALARAVTEVVNTLVVPATRVVGKFGLAYALARLAQSGMGCTVSVPANLNALDDKLKLFAEPFYQVLFAVTESDATQMLKLIAAHRGVVAERIGITGGSELVIQGHLRMPVAKLIENYTEGWRTHFEELA
jgi:phosphoribosylformylglycinamidine synthase